MYIYFQYFALHVFSFFSAVKSVYALTHAQIGRANRASADERTMAELAEEPGSAAVLEVSSQTRVEQESEQPPASSKDTVAEQNAAEGDDWQETEQGRVSKLECFTCGILRRRWRAKASKTPRLEFADDAQPPKQEKEEKQSQANGGSTSPQGTEEETTLKSPDEDTPSNKQEITDTQNAR